MKRTSWSCALAIFSLGCGGAASTPASRDDASDAGADTALGGTKDASDPATDARVSDAGDSHPPEAGTPMLRWIAAADVHMHNGCAGNFDIPLSMQLYWMKQAKINIGTLLIMAADLQRDWRYFRGREADDPLSEPDYVLHWDFEVSGFDIPLENGAYGGHAVMLNLPADSNLVKNGKPGFPGVEYTLPNFTYAHQQGGLIGMAHSGTWMPGSFNFHVPCCTPLELALDVMFEKVDFLADEKSPATPETENSINPGFLWIWYQMLNAGFNIPPAGGSDAGCIYRHENVGIQQTVVGLEPGQGITYASFIDAIRKGRTLIRTWNNAPRADELELRVNDVVGGGELVLPAGQQTVDIGVKASTALAGQKLELVINGTVAQQETLAAAAQTFTWKIKISTSSWVAARTKDAHTAAIFVLQGGCPVRNDAGSARRWKDALDQWYAQASPWMKTQAAEVKSKVELAKAAWERIAKEAEGTAKPVCKPM